MPNALSVNLTCARVAYMLPFQKEEDAFQWMNDCEYMASKANLIEFVSIVHLWCVLLCMTGKESV